MDYRTPIISQPGTLCVKPWVLLIIIVGFGLLLAWGALTFYSSNDATAKRLKLLEQSLDARQAEMEAMAAERDELLSRNAALERASQIDREAVRKIRESLQEDQEERLSMEEELTFLRGMMADKESRTALNIVSVALNRTDEERVVKYSFTVRKTLNDGETATGSIFLAVDGEEEGKAHWYPLRELTDDNRESLRMKFNHFQDVEGTLKLPASFTPSHLVIEIKPTEKGLSPVKERFAWVVGN